MMEIYLIYFLKVIVLQTILFGLYWLINRRSTNFHFNRYFLLAILVLPFITPLFRIPVFILGQDSTAEGTFDPWFFIEQSLPIVTIKGSQSLSSDVTKWTFLIVIIYLTVAFVSAIKMLYDYYRINLLAKLCSKKEFTPRGFRLLYVPTNILSFSFLNRIFLSDLFPINIKEKDSIITHEEYHLTQRHSLDIILAELVRILCWFNPIVLLIQKNLKETHEYLADRHTVIKYGKDEYASLLKSFKWHEINMLLGSAYSSSSIKKRVNMMEHSNKRSPIFQSLALSIIAVFTAFLFACENELDTFENKDSSFQYEFSEADLEQEINAQISMLTNAPQDIVDHYVTQQRKNPEFLYMPMIAGIMEQDLSFLTPEKLKTSLSKSNNLEFNIEFFREMNKNESNLYFSNFGEEHFFKMNYILSYAIIRKVDRRQYMEHRFKMNHEDMSIHDDYDKMGTFKGGMEALSKHLQENLRYPEIAKERGIEDRLVMRFVINKMGGLVYLNVDQEPSTSDEEVSLELQKAAFAAMQSTEGLWEPAEKDGKYVMSRMTLPIEFKLDK